MNGHRHVWTLASFERFREAAEEAAALSSKRFRVDLSRRQKGVEFDTEDALNMVATLSAEFANNPTPVFPENREGPEPC